MCGIIGYVGDRVACGILLDGLRRVEYRGYDSAGIAVLNGSGLAIRRRVGKVAALASLVADEPVEGTVGMGHTRWATHGRPSDENAHPHADCTGTIAVVHNGILENYAELKSRLSASGHRFRSETDTEVLAHLVEAHWTGGATDLVTAVQAALREVRGAYAIAVLAAGAPDRIVAAKHGAGSVVVGLGQGEAFLASDIPALLPLTRDVVILEDGEVAVLTRGGVSVTRLGRGVGRPPADSDHVGRGAGAARRPSALHAEGDLGSAAGRAGHVRRPAGPRGRTRGLSRTPVSTTTPSLDSGAWCSSPVGPRTTRRSWGATSSSA